MDLFRQLSIKGKYNQPSDNSIPTSPPKPNFRVMNVMTTNTISLEEHMTSLVKTMESHTASLKEKDDHMIFMMKRLLDLIGKRLVNEEVQ